MSDLAYSCEFFTAEKACNLVAENAKAKINRQARCDNAEKISCCYLCDTRAQCAISCKYLGSPDVAYMQVGPEKAETERKTDEPQTYAPKAQSANIIGKHCPSCNVEMSEANTILRVDDWRGPKPAMTSADLLPVLVYLCPRCGKIEFKADRQQDKDEAAL